MVDRRRGSDGPAPRESDQPWSESAALGLADLPFGARYLGFEVDDLADLEHLPVRPEVGIYVKPKEVSRCPTVPRSRIAC